MFGRIRFGWLSRLRWSPPCRSARRRPLNIRLATLAPDNSPWTSALRIDGHRVGEGHRAPASG